MVSGVMCLPKYVLFLPANYFVLIRCVVRPALWLGWLGGWIIKIIWDLSFALYL